MRTGILTPKQAKAIIDFINQEKAKSLTPPDATFKKANATVRTGDYRIGLSKAIEVIESVVIEKRKPKWLEFQELEMQPNKKTKTFLVWNKENDEVPIGEIKWYGPFRKYAFYPQPNTVYEPTCMQDITDFLNDLMDERKQAAGIREKHETWNDPHKMVKVSDDPLNYERREIDNKKPGFSKRSRDAQNGLLHLSDE